MVRGLVAIRFINHTTEGTMYAARRRHMFRSAKVNQMHAGELCREQPTRDPVEESQKNFVRTENKVQ